MSDQKPFMLKRTMTLAHDPDAPNYHFTDAEVEADAEDKAKAEAEAKAKAKGQDALRVMFQGIRHLPAVLPRSSAFEDARNRLKQAEADFTMANEEVLRAHKMNGDNVAIHVQSAVSYREDSRRRLAAAEEAYAVARQTEYEDATRGGGCGCGRCEPSETCGGGEGPPPTE